MQESLLVTFQKALFYPVFFTFSLPRNASRICTICLRFGGGSFSTWLNRYCIKKGSV